MSESTLTRKTNCKLCGYLCGLTAHFEDGKISRIEPDPDRYPYDVSIVQGCRRCRSNLELLDHPTRINYPFKRVGERGSGQWERISWDQALDEIPGRLDELRGHYGPETLATSIGGRTRPSGPSTVHEPIRQPEQYRNRSDLLESCHLGKHGDIRLAP